MKQKLPFLWSFVLSTPRLIFCSIKINFELTIFVEKNPNLKKVNKIMPNITCSTKTLNFGNSSKNAKFQNNFLFQSLR